MSKNPVIDKIRAIRDKHAKSFNFDLKAMFDDLRREQLEENLQVVSFPSKARKSKAKAA